MKNVLILFACCLVFSCDKSDDPSPIPELITEEYIIAGETNNYIYTDIIPDTTLSTWQIMGEEIFEIDLDVNGIDDFIIKAYYSTGISHEIKKVFIEPIDSNKIAFADSIPVILDNDTTSFVNLVKGVSFGDTINNDIEFRNKRLYMEIESYVTIFPAVDESWVSNDYIPICLVYVNGETYYGWIKVSDVSNRKITIESFAVNI